MAPTSFMSLPHVIRPAEGPDVPTRRLRTAFKVRTHLTQGRAAIVEHALPPRHLAAPLHRHSREDEISIVFEGQLGALLGGDVVFAGPGSYVMKPRGQWHTYWNAGDAPLRFVEVILPGGLEGYFERLSSMLVEGAPAYPAAIQSLAAEYGVELDFWSIPELCRRFDVTYR
jgi:quercetin dioxygenase-like cupin family protein